MKLKLNVQIKTNDSAVDPSAAMARMVMAPIRNDVRGLHFVQNRIIRPVL